MERCKARGLVVAELGSVGGCSVHIGVQALGNSVIVQLSEVMVETAVLLQHVDDVVNVIQASGGGLLVEELETKPPQPAITPANTKTSRHAVLDIAATSMNPAAQALSLAAIQTGRLGAGQAFSGVFRRFRGG